MSLIFGTVGSSSWVIDLFINTWLIRERYPLFAVIRDSNPFVWLVRKLVRDLVHSLNRLLVPVIKSND